MRTQARARVSDPLQKRLRAPHTSGCTIRRYSDRENRRCSCGREEALERAADLETIDILAREVLKRLSIYDF